MKHLISKFQKSDFLEKFGMLFFAFFIIPCCVALLIEVFTNGSNML